MVNADVVPRICTSRRFENLGFPLGRWDPIWFSYRRLHCHGFSNSRGHPNQWFCRQRETFTGEILFFCDYLFQKKLYPFFVCNRGPLKVLNDVVLILNDQRAHFKIIQNIQRSPNIQTKNWQSTLVFWKDSSPYVFLLRFQNFPPMDVHVILSKAAAISS